MYRSQEFKITKKKFVCITKRISVKTYEILKNAFAIAYIIDCFDYSQQLVQHTFGTKKCCKLNNKTRFYI